MIVSRRKHYLLHAVYYLVMVGLLGMGAPIANMYVWTQSNTLTIIGICMLILVEMALISTLIVVRIRGVDYFKLLDSLEKSLISIGAYNQVFDKSYVRLPKIKIGDDKIIIKLHDVKIRSIIEDHLDEMSTALPEGLFVEDYYITSDGSQVILEYSDISDFRPECYTLMEYVGKIKTTGPHQLYLDKKHTIDINDYPHLLISGSSGSGKTYLANELIVQSIVKRWRVVILDMKRSYGLYKDFVDYHYEIEDILETLKSVESEMGERMKVLQSRLDKNPRALATDVGYEPMIVILEEFIALQAALDKKEREELERIVRSISVLARQSCIHLIIVMQSAGTENIQATTRSNLTKILLGSAQSNILTATFGTGVDIPNRHVKLEKGAGLIQLDRISVMRVPRIDDIDTFRDVMR